MKKFKTFSVKIEEGMFNKLNESIAGLNKKDMTKITRNSWLVDQIKSGIECDMEYLEGGDDTEDIQVTPKEEGEVKKVTPKEERNYTLPQAMGIVNGYYQKHSGDLPKEKKYAQIQILDEAKALVVNSNLIDCYK